MPVCKQCSHIRSDLIFVIDGSWSVGEENFRLTKEFLKSLVLPFEIGYDYTRVAVVQYSDDPRVEFYLKTHLDKTELLNAIDSIPYKGGNTRTGDAIEFVMTNILDAKKGARPRVSKYCLLLTDGQSQDDVGNSARAIKNSGVKMFALGIGAARVDELKLIASPPFADTMYYETDYDAIKQLQEKLTNKFCEEVDSYGLYPQGFINTNLTGLLPVSR
jgi:collagen type XII alpha